MLFGSYIDSKRKQTWNYIEEWQTTVYSMVVFILTMVVMFWASVFLYTSFYFTYMPQESITWPIHFQYKSCTDQPGICSNPQAVVGVTDPSRGSLLARGQKYRVVVDLEMPESVTNQRLGMFLVSMDMRSHGGESLKQASRSTMLRYKSPLLQIINTFIFAPFFLYGVQEEKQMVTVELFAQYEEDPVTSLSEVHVQMFTKHVELYGAQLRIHAMFSGLRYFMYTYTLTAAALGISICMVFLSLVVIFSWYGFSGSSRPMQATRPTLPNGRAKSFGPGIAVTTTKPGDALPKLTKKSGLEETSADRKGSRDEGSRKHSWSEKRDSEDFEVVSSSKDPVDEESSRAARALDEDSEMRQRVQAVEAE